MRAHNRVKTTTTILLAILLLTHLSTSPMAFAWDPATDGLGGTDSSTDTNVAGALRRFDIDSTTAGLQIGEDGDSIAFLLVMVPLSGGNGFRITGMVVGDQYQVSFTIASTDFTLVFRASGSKAGTLTLFYGGSTGEIFSVSNVKSGTAYRSVSGDIGLTLTSGTSIKLVVSKGYLYSLGGTETVITGIFGATFEAGDGTPGSGGATPKDRCPASGEVSFSLLQGIDDFPHGTLVLAIPVMGLYVLFRRKKSAREEEDK